MRPNTTKRKLLAGEPAIGIFASSASPLVAEALGGLGFDWVLVDLQHGENNLGNLSTMLQAVSATAATPFVRVPINDFMQIGRALDLGAYGIVVPLVNSPEEAEAAVRAAKYPPRGARSWGPIRGALYGGGNYFREANDKTALFVMIETAQAVERARDILAVDGVDGCYVGPNDLSISLGLQADGAIGTPWPDPVEEALVTVLAACRETGTIAGIQLYSGAGIVRHLERGFHMVSLGSEVRLLRLAVGAELRAVER